MIEGVKCVTAVGITSGTIAKAEELANRFHIDHVYERIDDLMEICVPDAIMVVVSANQIFEVTEELILIGIPLIMYWKRQRIWD